MIHLVNVYLIVHIIRTTLMKITHKYNYVLYHSVGGQLCR